jgi:hypothetical protein
MSACGAELLLLESVRPVESSNFRTRVPNKRLKGTWKWPETDLCTKTGAGKWVHQIISPQKTV